MHPLGALFEIDNIFIGVDDDGNISVNDTIIMYKKRNITMYKNMLFCIPLTSPKEKHFKSPEAFKNMLKVI